MAIWSILRPLEIFCGHLVYFWSFGIFFGHLVHFPHFGILYEEKSGNPGREWLSPIAKPKCLASRKSNIDVTQ
jgi:hypothetical protein